MYKQMIKDKFKLFGFVLENIDEKLEELDKIIPLSQYSALELKEKIEFISYEKPTQEIAKFYLNKEHEKFFMLHGDINYKQQQILGELTFDFVDYPLSENLCMIGMDNDKIRIMLFLPDYNTITRYGDKNYEDIFASTRNELMNHYAQSILSKNTLTEKQVNKIVNLLVTDYIIDTIMLENKAPRLKLCYNIENFAESITNYKYKYINKVDLRVEKLDKSKNIKYAEKNIVLGTVSNEAYLPLNSLGKCVDFSLKEPSYVWFVLTSSGKEELWLYTAKQDYEEKTYQEYLSHKKDEDLKREAEILSMQFSNEVGYTISVDTILESLKKLNRELIISPTELLKNEINKNIEEVELPKYKYKVTTNPIEFESLLYNTIEEKMKERYLCRFVECVNGLYTKIGNKIKYTDSIGQEFNESSIADFNQNANIVILKKETLLLKESVTTIRKNGFSNEIFDFLPIPILEVIFYFPKEKVNSEVSMYNQTSIGESLDNVELNVVDKKDNKTKSSSNSNLRDVKIRYVTNEGKVLNELIIKDLIVGDLYTPQIPLNYKDEQGRIWVCEKIENSIYVSENKKQNLLEIVYIKKLAQLQIEYITQSGVVLKKVLINDVQVGERYSLNGTERFLDDSGVERKLCSEYQEYIIITEDNNLIQLIYGDEKTNVFISYLTKDNQEIKETEIVLTGINEDFSPEINNYIIDSKGLQWEFLSTSSEKIYVEKNKENKINLYYERSMRKVIIRYVDEEENSIKGEEIKHAQVGEKIIIKQETVFIDEIGRYWKNSSENREVYLVSEKEENIILMRYSPILENMTILFHDKDGNELRGRKTIPAQIGTIFEYRPLESVKDKKGNEWKLVHKYENTILVKENEKENMISYTYEVAKAKIYIKYLKTNGEVLKKEECLLRQVGSGLVSTPDALVYDENNLCWKLSKIQPAILKVREGENEVIITYEQALGKVVWKYTDLNGNMLKNDDIQFVQIGTQYSPLIQERVIYKSEEVWKLMEIKPNEIIISENEEENVIELIYSNAK